MKLRCSGQERVALTFPPAKSKSGKPGQSSGVAGDFLLHLNQYLFRLRNIHTTKAAARETSLF